MKLTLVPSKLVLNNTQISAKSLITMISARLVKVIICYMSKKIQKMTKNSKEFAKLPVIILKQKSAFSMDMLLNKDA